MLAYLRDNFSQLSDGLFFGLGLLTIYLGAVITGALIRSLGGAGSMGLSLLGRFATGWFDYVRGDDRNTINITLNMVVDNHLKFDTIVADRRVWDIWPNSYRIYLIREAAKKTTRENPIITFPQETAQHRHRLRRWITNLFVRSTVVENGRRQRVHLVRDDDYRATYSPLISLMSENCSNDDSVDVAIGRPMNEYRFVIALTYEQLESRRARHLRAMVMWEQELLSLPAEMPRVSFEQHKTRYRTLLSIAREYRAHPERFGVVNVWRPKDVASPQRLSLGAAGLAAATVR
ncbi:MAG: hypothetical protein JO000_25045 [Alphaproteobacteria bacterium]|nr:hypothetical protein [Alphaproteobacteria bacterium]